MLAAMSLRPSIFWLICAAFVVVGCNDRTRDPGGVTNPGTRGDEDADAGEAEAPVRALCVPRSRRCITENSPLFDECASDGASFVRGACDDGEVCRESGCVPFTCVPDRPLCVGPTTSASCDTDGASVYDLVDCEGDTVCLGGACVDRCAQAAGTRSYIGCDYVADDLPNIVPNTAFGVVVANTDPLVSSTVRLTSLSGGAVALRERAVLQPGSGYAFGEPTAVESRLFLNDGTDVPIESTETILPPGASAVFLPMPGSVRLTSSRPVVAYQFNPYCCNFTASNDASLLLPVATWSTRYRVAGYPAWASGGEGDVQQAYVRVVAVEASDVEVDSPVPLLLDDVGEPSRTHSFSLSAGGFATLTTAIGPEGMGSREADLSGTVVESSAPVGVFVGHPCTFVPQDKWACDHLEESVLPSQTLGERYVLSPVLRRSSDVAGSDVSEATYWRIVADEAAEIEFEPPLADVTIVTPSAPSSQSCASLVGDNGLLQLDEGEVCELGLKVPVSILSRGTVAVVGVISGHQSTGTRAFGQRAGDPSLFQLGPVEQFRSDYSFVNPPTFADTYVTVTAPPGAPVTLDGRSIRQDARLDRRTTSLDGTEWEVFTVELEPGAHRIAADLPIGIVVYAYDDYVSYAFTGGLDLLPKGAVRP